MRRSSHALLLSLFAFSCAEGDRHATTGAGGAGGAFGATTASVSSSQNSSSGPGAGGAPPLPQVCEVDPGGLDATPFCLQKPPLPLEGFELVEKWSYSIEQWAHFGYFPIVANLTDDNGDGRIDLCDTPDILVQAYYWPFHPQTDGIDTIRLLIFSGTGGAPTVLDTTDLSYAIPAIADLDADGIPEILTTTTRGRLVALSPSGSLLWESSAEVFDPHGYYGIEPNPTDEQRLAAAYVTRSSVAVHDLDADGSPEILVGMSVFHADGSLRFADPTRGAEFGLPPYYAAVRPTVADLDGDGRLEVLFGHVAYDADGVELWRLPTTTGFATPADFDGDGLPEVLVASHEGLTLVASDGTILRGPSRPPDDAPPPRLGCWTHPVAAADLNGDGLPEALVNNCVDRMVLRITPAGPEILQSHPVALIHDVGAPTQGSTAFDFRGLGYDWLSHSHSDLRLHDGMAHPALSNITTAFADGYAYPVVADVDNDGSADLVTLQGHHPTRLVIYEDAQRRPSPARRIWNQWSYWAGAVREDAIVPAQIAAPWSGHQSYRTQARLDCRVAQPPN